MDLDISKNPGRRIETLVLSPLYAGSKEDCFACAWIQCVLIPFEIPYEQQIHGIERLGLGCLGLPVFNLFASTDLDISRYPRWITKVMILQPMYTGSEKDYLISAWMQRMWTYFEILHEQQVHGTHKLDLGYSNTLVLEIRVTTDLSMLKHPKHMVVRTILIRSQAIELGSENN